MHYIDLEDQAIRRMVSIQAAVEKSDYIMNGPRDSKLRGMVDFFVKKNQIDSPLLTKALSAVNVAENRVRKARLSNLSGLEKKKFEKQILSDLVKCTEAARLTEIKSAADALFKMRNTEVPSNATAELLKLEKLKLRHRVTDEATAMANMAGMERRGYDANELLVLSAISEKTNARAKEVKETLPPRLANDVGLKLIEKLETLLNLKPGEIAYSLRDAPNVVEKIHVGDLLQDVAPTANDLVGANT